MDNEKKEWTESEKAEYAERKRKEKEAFLTARQAVFFSIPENKALYKNYLQVQTRLTESPLNTVWIAMQNPSAKRVHTYSDWKEKGCTVKRGANGIQVLSSHEYVDSKGESRLGYKVIKVYDVSQLETPYELPETVKMPVTKFIEVFVASISEKIDIERAKQEKPYTIQSYSDRKDKLGKVTIFNEINDTDNSYALILIMAACELYFQSYLNEKEYGTISDPQEAAFDVAFMILSKYLDDKTFVELTNIDGKRFEGRKLQQMNSELKHMRSFYALFSKKIDSEFPKHK